MSAERLEQLLYFNWKLARSERGQGKGQTDGAASVHWSMELLLIDKKEGTTVVLKKQNSDPQKPSDEQKKANTERDVVYVSVSVEF